MGRSTQRAQVPPPEVGASNPFRVADIRQQANNFLNELSRLLSAAPSAGTAALFLEAFDVSDLRLQTNQEALQQLDTQFQKESEQQPTADGPSTEDGVDTPSEGNGGNNTVAGRLDSASTIAPEGYTERKARIQQAYNEAVAKMIHQRAAARQSATQFLKTLQRPEKAQPKKAFTKERSRVRLNQGDEVQREAQQQQTVDEEKRADAAGPSNAGAPAIKSSLIQRPSRLALPTAEYVTIEAIDSSDKISTDEVVLQVAVYIPQAPSHVSEEWLVLGSQKLTELKDVIYCLAEKNILEVELKENERRGLSNIPPLGLSKAASYFYIEGTFFVDSRKDKNANELAESIRRYNIQHGVQAPPHPPPGPANRPLPALVTDFSLDSMQDRKFEDLWLRIGPQGPGLYCHQGGCEHLLVFKDVRKHDPAVDPPLRSQYPLKIANYGEMLSQRRNCEVCVTNKAQKVTYDDRNAPHSPFFWCNECFRLMHYSRDGKALYTDFKVFPYTHDYQGQMLQFTKNGK